MAFGGRELRLILSIQSYGTSNIARLRRDILALDNATNAANLRQLQQLEVTGRTVAHFGRTAQFAGLLTTAAFGVAANSAANFSKEVGVAATQMRNIGAPISDTTKKAGILSDSIVKMMMRFPASAEEMSDAAYDIFSSMDLVHKGIVDTSAGLKLLEVANRAAVAGQVDLTEATGAMIPVLNNFDPQLRHVGKTMNDVFSIVRFGQMRLNDLGTAMATLAPIAGAAGISLKNMGGPFATLTLLMKNQQRAAFGLGRLFELLRLPAFEKGFRAMGVSVLDANHQLRPLLAIMKDIVRVHPEVATGQKAAIEFFIQVSKASGLTKAGIQGTIQARRAFELLATHMGLFADTQEHVNKNTKEMDKAFAFMSKQPGVQWAVFINTLKALVLVIGREALPVFLALGQRISDTIKWFQTLSPHTRKLIVQIAVISGLVALFGGTLANLAGSIIAMVASFRLMTLAAGGLAGKLMLSLNLLRGIAAIGVIATFLKVAWSGNASAVDFLAAAAGGAALGSIFGPGGAVLGAITVPVLLKITSNLRQQRRADPAFEKWVMKNYGPDKLKRILAPKKQTGWQTYLPGGGWIWGVAKGDLKEYDRLHSRYAKIRKIHNNFINDVKATAKGLLPADTLRELNSGLDSINSALVDAASLAKRRIQEVAQAQENMNRKIQSAVDNLAQIYDNFRQVNEQGLGSVFGGPTMQGIIGNVFSSINDLVRQFGVQIPVPFQILQQDMNQQLIFFKRWRAGIDKLLKRGAPLELVQQIEQLGPSAIPMIEGLLGASPKQLRGYFKNFKNAQKLLDKAAKADMDRQLREWESHGKNIAWQLISGLSSNAAQVKLKTGFHTYVVNTFGGVLRAEMADEIAKAMTQAAAELATGNVTTAGIAPATRTAARRMNAIRAATRGGFLMRPAGGLQPIDWTSIQRREHARRIQWERAHGGRELTVHHGDNVTIHADGATPAAVGRALNKHDFHRRHKPKKRR